ncbi:unnamed protein product [Prunus brigantina]
MTLFSSNNMPSATIQATATIPPIIPASETIAPEPPSVASRHCPTTEFTLHGPTIGTTVHPHRFTAKTASHANVALLPHHLAVGSSNPPRGLMTGCEACHHGIAAERHQRDPQAILVEDVEKLVNNRLRDLKISGDFDDALRREVDQANSTPFTTEIEQPASSKQFSIHSFTYFKGDSNPESHLKHFKRVMLHYKADDA